MVFTSQFELRSQVCRDRKVGSIPSSENIANQRSKCNNKGKSAAYQKLCKIGYVKKEGHILPENRKATQKLRRIHPWIQQ
jgi:hypothetical protein